MKTLDQEQYQLVIEKCTDSALDAIWEMLSPVHQGWTHFPPEVTGEFSSRTECFFGILCRLLREGRIKLHKNGVFLEGTNEEQIQRFRESFPCDEEEADRISTKPGYEAPYKHFGMDVWWFLDICPAGVAWRQPDGSYLIAD